MLLCFEFVRSFDQFYKRQNEKKAKKNVHRGKTYGRFLFTWIHTMVKQLMFIENSIIGVWKYILTCLNVNIKHDRFSTWMHVNKHFTRNNAFTFENNATKPTRSNHFSADLQFDLLVDGVLKRKEAKEWKIASRNEKERIELRRTSNKEWKIAWKPWRRAWKNEKERETSINRTLKRLQKLTGGKVRKQNGLKP